MDRQFSIISTADSSGGSILESKCQQLGVRVGRLFADGSVRSQEGGTSEGTNVESWLNRFNANFQK